MNPLKALFDALFVDAKLMPSRGRPSSESALSPKAWLKRKRRNQIARRSRRANLRRGR